MRLKYYLRGLGIGILFATVILMISYHVVHKEDAMTDADIIIRAKELGMVEATESKSNDINANDINADDPGTELDDTQIPDTQETEPVNPEEQTSETVEPLILNIEAGSTWRQTCQMMENAGLIASADELYRYYVSQYGVSGKALKVGSYTIPYGSDFDTILNIFFPQQ